MTSAEVLSKANSGNIASPEMDLESVLFDEIIPELLADTGRTSWTIKHTSASVTAGNRTFDLPSDCRRVERLSIGEDSYPVPYVGDSQEALLASEAATATGVAVSWYYTTSSTGKVHGAVKLTAAMGDDAVVNYSYRWSLPNSAVDLGFYIPVEWHAALIAGVKREIYLDRWGVGDKRVDAAAQKFDAWKNRIIDARDAEPIGARVVNLRSVATAPVAPTFTSATSTLTMSNLQQSPQETPNGVITTFTFTNYPRQLFINGIAQHDGVHFTRTANAITLNYAPAADDDIFAFI